MSIYLRTNENLFDKKCLVDIAKNHLHFKPHKNKTKKQKKNNFKKVKGISLSIFKKQICRKVMIKRY